jgi:hypothetical protein
MSVKNLYIDTVYLHQVTKLHLFTQIKKGKIMNKFLSVFFALAICSSAQSESFLNMQFSKYPGDVDADRYTRALTITSVKDNISLQGGFAIGDVLSDSDSAAVFSVDVGLQSFGLGTLYAGTDLSLSDFHDSEHAVTIGYSKRKIDELGYDFSVSSMDGESIYGALIRIPLANSYGGGALIGFAESDSYSQFTLGYSVGF